MTLLRQDHFDVARMVDDLYQTVQTLHLLIRDFPMDADDQENFEFMLREAENRASNLASFYESKVEE